MRKLTKKYVKEFLEHDYTSNKVFVITNVCWRLLSNFDSKSKMEDRLDALSERIACKSLKDIKVGNNGSYTFLECINSISSGCCGIESIYLYTDKERTQGGYLDYINTGDTYSPSILLWDGDLYEGCWGDFEIKYFTGDENV